MSVLNCRSDVDDDLLSPSGEYISNRVELSLRQLSNKIFVALAENDKHIMEPVYHELNQGKPGTRQYH